MELLEMELTVDYILQKTKKQKKNKITELETERETSESGAEGKKRL